MTKQYLIHQDKMHELNLIVGQQGGPATSAVSDALAAGDLERAIAANKLDGKAWENVQRWHDKRINEDEYTGGPGPGPTPPTPIPPGTVIPVENIYPNGVNHDLPGMQPGGLYTYQLLGDEPGRNVSYSRPGWAWCNIAYGRSPGSRDHRGQSGMGSALIFEEVPPGQYVTMWLNEDATPIDNAIYSAS